MSEMPKYLAWFNAVAAAGIAAFTGINNLTLREIETQVSKTDIQITRLSTAKNCWTLQLMGTSKHSL
jgi:hypothetical protein